MSKKATEARNIVSSTSVKIFTSNELPNPRENAENLGTIFCWNKRSYLGDPDAMADFKLAYSHYSGEIVYELAAELLRLREKLPKKGRLAMKFMKPEAKAEIYAFLRELLELNDDCKREYEMYLHSAVELTKFYSADPDDHEDAEAAASDEIMSRMGNVVLKLIKKLNEVDFKFRDEIRREAYRRQMIESLITEIFGVLARAAKSAADNVQHTRCYGDLSKQAKKEYAIKFEGDTGYEWER